MVAAITLQIIQRLLTDNTVLKHLSAISGGLANTFALPQHEEARQVLFGLQDALKKTCIAHLPADATEEQVNHMLNSCVMSGLLYGIQLGALCVLEERHAHSENN